MRRRGSIIVLLAWLAGCDRGLHAEVAALHEQVEAQAEAQQVLRARIDQLEADLAREGAARREGDAAREVPPPVPSPPASPPGPTLNPVCEKGTCTVTRAEVEALFADTDALVKAARIIPAIVDGKTDGFKLFGIREGTPFAALGLQNGDQVRELGGVKLSSVEAMMTALADLKKQTRWVIRGTRKGAPLELTVEVK